MPQQCFFATCIPVLTFVSGPLFTRPLAWTPCRLISSLGCYLCPAFSWRSSPVLFRPVLRLVVTPLSPPPTSDPEGQMPGPQPLIPLQSPLDLKQGQEPSIQYFIQYPCIFSPQAPYPPLLAAQPRSALGSLCILGSPFPGSVTSGQVTSCVSQWIPWTGHSCSRSHRETWCLLSDQHRATAKLLNHYKMEANPTLGKALS